ncbi:hypothetical protein N9933_03520, partial [bacterium]|nr:hypothetical protein [bacterium]
EAAKMAYEHFERAGRLKPNFKNSRAKMAEARDLATVHVLIQPIPLHSRALSLSNEFFSNQIIEYVRGAGFSPFVRFYDEKEVRSLQREPDQVIQMIFDDFVVGQASIKETVYQREADSVIVGQVKVKEDGEYVEKRRLWVCLSQSTPV